MLLIEAINMKSGGGINLIVGLVTQLLKHDIPFRVLINKIAVIPNLPEENRILVDNISFYRRGKTVADVVKKINPKSILTFNYPLPINLGKGIKVITDFQNLHLVDSYASFSSSFSLKDRLLWKIKRIYIKLFFKNTDLYTTPTLYINEEFKKTYGGKVSCEVLSYFDKDLILELKNEIINEGIKKKKNSFIYVSAPVTHKNHSTLLDAWEILIDEKIDVELKLTLPSCKIGSEAVLERIKDLNNKGGNIINISEGGFLDYKEILKETYSSSFTIFPSLMETFGFGLIEGTLLDNKILVSDKEFAYRVVKPTLTFNPSDANSIVKAVKKILTSDTKKTELIFTDQTSRLIQILNSPNRANEKSFL